MFIGKIKKEKRSTLFLANGQELAVFNYLVRYLPPNIDAIVILPPIVPFIAPPCIIMDLNSIASLIEKHTAELKECLLASRLVRNKTLINVVNQYCYRWNPIFPFPA